MKPEFDVVISGISGRFPECDDINIFKHKLYNNCNSEDFITNDERKWPRGFKLHQFSDSTPIPQATGKYTAQSDFDYRLFKFNQFMAQSSDAINRKYLESSFEAVVDAGINPYSLDGANVGVYMTAGIGEMDMYFEEKTYNGISFVFGNSRTMGPNRISYTLNLTGPSFSSISDPLGDMEMLRLAVSHVADGTIEAAIVGVANNLFLPSYSRLYETIGLLTTEDFCRCFDNNANGFVRSESTIVLFLQREEEAKRVYAKLVFCDTLYNGPHSHALIGHDEQYFRNSLRTIYERNMCEAIAEDLSFIELTGCAVKNLETMETNAIADVLTKRRKNPLLIGSIKSSVGHTEASSALLSVLKVIFALDSQIIAPNVNYTEPNDDIRAFREKQLQVVVEKTKLLGSLAAVNITGLFGKVSHLVLQKNPKEPLKNSPTNEDLPRLLFISGRTENDLKKVLLKIELDTYNVEAVSLTNDVFCGEMPFHIYRGYTILPKKGKFTAVVEERGDTKRPICFLFSGMGSQWNGMGRRLLNLPVFADVIKRCDAVLKPKSIDIYDILLSDDPSLFDNITFSFVGITCIQIALFEVLRKLKIKPDLILGHSTGETACAYADGCLTLEQTVLVSYFRGVASRSVSTIKGMMAAVGLGNEEIKNSLPESIQVACHNAANNCTISGPAEDVENYVRELKKTGIFAKSVNVANIAYHSRYIEPVAPKLQQLLQEIIPHPKQRSSKWICSSVPETCWNSPLARSCSVDYITNNLRSPVLFEEASKHIPQNALVIEIAPHGLLQAILKRSLPETCTNVPLTNRSFKQDNLKFLLSAIGKLYLAGCQPIVNNLYPQMEYPVSRGTPSISPYCTWFHGDTDSILLTNKPIKSVPLSMEDVIPRLNQGSEFSFLKHHQINEQTIIPTSFFLHLVWRMLSLHKNVKMDDFPVLFENVKVHRSVEISVFDPLKVNILIQGSGAFEVVSRTKYKHREQKTVLTGRIEFMQDEAKIPWNNPAGNKYEIILKQDEINNILAEAGFQLGPDFQVLTNLEIAKSVSIAKIRWNGNIVIFLDAVMKFLMISELRQSKMCYLYSFRKMLILPSAVSSLEIGSEVICCHDKLVNVFQCLGVEINDAKWKISPLRSNAKSSSSLKIRKMRFVSHNNPSCQNLDEFMEYCLQIVAESFGTTVEINSKLNICDCTGRFIECIQNTECITSLPETEISHCDVKLLRSQKIAPDGKYFIIIEENVNSINTLQFENLFVLLLSSDHNPTFENVRGFSTILKQSFSGKTFHLLKKSGGCITEFRLEKNNNYKYIGSNGPSSAKIEIIVCPKLDSSHLKTIFSKKKHPYSRYLFVSNEKQLADNDESWMPSKPFYDLPVSVFKNKDWGSYRYLPSQAVNDPVKILTTHCCSNNIRRIKPRMTNNSDGIGFRIENIKVEFLREDSVTTQSEAASLETENKFIGIEFSGVSTSGQRVMGLTSVNSNEPTAKLDPLLTWNVPDEWTSVEAVNVLAIYTRIFHILNVIEHSYYMPTPTILVNAGDDMLVVEVWVSLCVLKHYIIYVTVSSTKQVSRLRQNCPWLQESQIILNENHRFDLQVLRKTKKKGVNVVVNYLSGIRNLTASMNCVSEFSYYIETVESNMNENYEIGMSPFGMSLYLIASPNRISHLLNLRDDDKCALHEAVEDGIKTGFVRPVLQSLKNEIITGIRRMGEVEAKINSKSSSVINEPSCSVDGLKFKPNHSYIILGGKHSEESLIKLIYWLKEKGASSFVVILEKFVLGSRMSHQINSLLTNRKMTVLFKSLSKLNSVEDAVQLIEETNKTAPLDSVFFVSLESNTQKIRFMNVASQRYDQNIKFISLFSDGLEEMETRRNNGLPAFVLHGECFPKQVSDILMEFEKLLNTYDLQNDSSVLYHVLDETNETDFEDEICWLRHHLPKNVECLERIGRHTGYTTEKIEFVEVTSKCLKLADCKGVSPIFVIPGLHAFELQPLFLSLMYPVFCALPTANCFSVRDAATQLFEHLKRIQPRGPVNIIGETWNAAIAIELSSLIKEAKRDFKLFLLEGDPIQWKETITSLNLKNDQDFEKILIQIYGEELRRSFSLPDGIKESNTSLAASNDFGVDPVVNPIHVRRCLNVLRQLFINTSEHHVKNCTLENTFLFSKKVRQNILSILSNTSDIIFIAERNYETFKRSPMICNKINKESKFHWNYL